jgi:hypothetical protein
MTPTRAAEIPNSKLLVIPDCSHAPLPEKLEAERHDKKAKCYDSDPAVKFKQKTVKPKKWLVLIPPPRP